jgi:hypothetical protein
MQIGAENLMEIQNLFLHFVYRLQRTWKLFVAHFDGKWGRFFVEESGAGVLATIVGLYMTQTSLNVQSIKQAFYAGVIGMFLWMCIILLWSYFKAPSSLFFEERKEAGKYNWHDVMFKVYFFPKPSIYGVGLCVRNMKAYDIESVSARIVKMRYITENRDWSMSDEIRFLPWVMEDETLNRMPQQINKSGDLLLQIFQWNAGGVWIPTGFQEEPNEKGVIGYRAPHNSIISEPLNNISHLGKYYIEIEFTGKINDCHLPPYIYKAVFEVNPYSVYRVNEVKNGKGIP